LESAGGAGRKIVLRSPWPDEAVARLGAAFPEAAIVACPDDRGLAAHLADAEVLVGGAGLAVGTAARAPRLRWVQALSVGVEGYLELARTRPDIVVANARGVNVTPVAEHALMLMLSFARGMPDLARRQAGHRWLPATADHVPAVFELSGATLGLIGYGEIGRAIAARGKAFGMNVWALRRRGAVTAEGPADRILGAEGLAELLAAADHVVATVPLTAATDRLMDTAAFATMKPGAFFYNLGRGGVVDHDALAAALASGRLGGAGLEVVEPEPLPPVSPLWSMPNVIITGHTAGFTPKLLARNLEFLVAQFERYRRGEPLANRIDGMAGY
jgi:phosphoglycerate dehydrogenase-like enzyme